MKSAKLQLIAAMLIFGSIPIFVRSLPFTSAQIAIARGIVGSAFLFVYGVLLKRAVSWERIRPNLPILLASGAALGFNWILLFQAYRYTSVSNATIGYYFAPVIVMFLSPWVLKEPLNALKAGCILAALAGMVCIAGVGGGAAGGTGLLGIALALGAAALYATIVLLNKFLRGVSGIESSLMQLGLSALALLPYVMFTDGLPFASMTLPSGLLLLLVGVLHTGFVYLLYFSVLQKLPGQTVAVYSYIDPVSAILMSALFLGESLTAMQMLGGALVLGATFVNERFGGRAEVPAEEVAVELGG